MNAGRTPLRVLHVYKSYFPETRGGLEETIHQICRATGTCGVDNRILTLSNRGNTGAGQWGGVDVLRYRRNLEIASCGMSLPALMDFRRQAAAVDLVHYHFPWPFADLMHLLCRVRTPAVVTYHSDVVRQRTLMRFYRPLMRWFLGRVNTIVTTSPNYGTSSEVLREMLEKVEVIPIGLDAETYPSPEKSRLAQLERELGKDFFLFVGILRYYKGLHVLLDAVAGTDLPVVIAGTGPIEAELKQHADRLGLSNVRFLGPVSNEDKAALYALSRAVIFPSRLRSEAFGVTLVEGAMYGKPLISTELGTGTSYVNLDGTTGFVVPPDDGFALRDAMQRLTSDNDLARDMGHSARIRYDELFTAQRMGERYAAIYEGIIAKEEDTLSD